MHHDVKISGARIRTNDLWIRKRVCYPLHHAQRPTMTRNDSQQSRVYKGVYKSTIMLACNDNNETILPTAKRSKWTAVKGTSILWSLISRELQLHPMHRELMAPRVAVIGADAATEFIGHCVLCAVCVRSLYSPRPKAQFSI